MTVSRLFVLAGLMVLSTGIMGQSFVSTRPQNRNVLVEEYTGVGCQYCPLGHKAVDQTVHAFPGHAFAINIHQGTFAMKYTTQWGDALARQATVTGYPSATMNRHAFGGNGIQINPGQAYPFALKVMDMPAPVNVAATVDIDPATRLMVVKVEAYYPGNGPGDFNLINVALLQNNVLGSQTGGSTYYPENMVGGQYRHNHILRHLLTGQWGDTIHHTEAGSVFVKEYAYVVPQRIGDLDITNLDDLSVLVFVCEDHKEVLNVCEAVRVADKAYIAYGNSGGEECSMLFNPFVTVVNPTDEPITDLRFAVDGGLLVRHKTINPYCSDTVHVQMLSVDEMPSGHQNYSRTCNVRLQGYTTGGGQTVSAEGETFSIDYADIDIYTVQGPLTLSITYDNFPDEVTHTLAGIADCRFYYETTGVLNDAGRTVDYTLSPATAGLYRLKLFDIGGDGLDGNVSVTDAQGNTLFTRNGKDLMVWDDIYFNITNNGTDGPRGTVVGIEEHDSALQEWSFWPNPVRDRLHIDAAVPVLRAEVVDMTGRLCVTAQGADVEVASLSAGIYLLRVVTAEGVSMKKFIKQ